MKTISPKIIKNIQNLRETGNSVRILAKKFGLNKATISKYVKNTKISKEGKEKLENS